MRSITRRRLLALELVGLSLLVGLEAQSCDTRYVVQQFDLQTCPTGTPHFPDSVGAGNYWIAAAHVRGKTWCQRFKPYLLYEGRRKVAALWVGSRRGATCQLQVFSAFLPREGPQIRANGARWGAEVAGLIAGALNSSVSAPAAEIDTLDIEADLQSLCERTSDLAAGSSSQRGVVLAALDSSTCAIR